MKCAECGSTTIRRIYDATITVTLDVFGNEKDWTLGDVNKIDDDPIEECDECGSYTLEEN